MTTALRSSCAMALNVLRRLRRAPQSRTVTVARSSAGLALTGVLLASILALVMDIAGVLASPIR